MSKIPFNISVVARPAVPRSEKLRGLGVGSVASVRSGSGSAGSAGGSGGVAAGHSHENKALLDKLGESDGYLLLLQREENAQSSEEVRVKAGFADAADTLDGKHFADIKELIDGKANVSHSHAISDVNGLSDALDEKVDKEEGKGLSTNDYTDADKAKLSELDSKIDQSVKTTDEVQFAGVTTQEVQSPSFLEGFGGHGFKLDTNGLEVDNLVVRKAMQVFELIIQQLKHQGGIVIYSAASIECTRVVNLGSGYKCFFDNKNGSLPCEFIPNDLARCQRFNIGGSSAKYYWRKVTSIGDDFIVLSASDCDSGSGVPEAGDVIAQFGNKTDASRQAVKITTCIGVNTPRDEYYKNVNSYDLSGKLVTIVGVNDGRVGVWTIDGAFEGKVTIGAGSAGLESLSEWAAASQRITDAQETASQAAEGVSAAQKLLDQYGQDIAKLEASLNAIDEDNILTVIEKRSLRTEWEKINGSDSALGSYQTTLQLVAEIGYCQGEQVIYTYGDIVLTYDGLKLVHNYTGIEDFAAAYVNLSDYLLSIKLYADENTEGFERKKVADLLTAYYDSQRILLDLAEEYRTLSATAELQNDLKDIQDTANTAKSQLEEWANDNKISSVEKIAIESERRFIEKDKIGLDSQVLEYGVNASSTSTYNAFISAYTAYYAALTTIINGFTAGVTSVDIPADFQAKQTAFYNQRNSLYALVVAAAKALASSAKEIAEGAQSGLNSKVDKTAYNNQVNSFSESIRNAQSAADGAATAASNAQAAANAAAASANTANNALSEISNDNKLTPSEKREMKLKFDEIVEEYSENISLASVYGVSSSAYTQAYNNLNAVIAPLISNLAITSDCSGVSIRTLFALYYEKRAQLLNTISVEAKERADEAYEYADRLNGIIDNINSDFVLDRSEKRNIKTQWELIYLGSYPQTLALAATLGIDTSKTEDIVIDFGGDSLRYADEALIFADGYSAWVDQLQFAYRVLADYMYSLNLDTDECEYYFSRIRYANLMAAYLVAEKALNDKVQGLYTSEAIELATKVQEDTHYLIDLFDNSLNINGVTLAQMMAVKTDNNAVNGIFNGSLFGADPIKGRLMIATGIPSGEGSLEERARTAATRIYEDGSVISNKGEFEDVQITNAHIEEGDITSADIHDADIYNCNAEGGYFHNISVDVANITNAHIIDADISGIISSGNGLRMIAEGRSVIVMNSAVDDILASVTGSVNGNVVLPANITNNTSSQTGAISGLQGGKIYSFDISGSVKVTIPSGYAWFKGRGSSSTGMYAMSVTPQVAVSLYAKSYSATNSLDSNVLLYQAYVNGSNIDNPLINEDSFLPFEAQEVLRNFTTNNNSVRCSQGGYVVLEVRVAATPINAADHRVSYSSYPSLQFTNVGNHSWYLSGGEATTIIGSDGILVAQGQNYISIKNSGNKLEMKMLGLSNTPGASGSGILYRDNNGFLKVS